MKNQKKNYNLFLKFLGILIKNGKKTKARKLLSFSFFKVGLLTNKPIFYILLKLFKKLNVYVETKTLRIRRSRYVVPFPININRRIYLILKWFVFIIRKNKEKKSFADKFVSQFISILYDSKSEVMNLKILNNSQAVLNRSNIHYRW
jgi:ribosomal protein S7